MIREILLSAQTASHTLLTLPPEEINSFLLRLADVLESSINKVIEANEKDLDKMDPEDPRYDRLLLSSERISAMSQDLRNVAQLPTPLGKILYETVRPNGMKITKITVPFGVIGVIYESRPNVTTDVFSLCFKAGSACVLKGGKEASETNRQLVNIIHSVLSERNLPKDLCLLLPNDHETTAEMLSAVGLIDLVIPRGSSRLINFVRDTARVSVIETGAGICHTYFDASGDLDKGREIVLNGKTRRVSVCNALDCLLIHASRIDDLPEIVRPLADKNVLLYADPMAYSILQGKYPDSLLQVATEEHYGLEMLSYKMAIKVVPTLDVALAHIAQHSSRHSESIVSEDEEVCRHFSQMVDAACVYTNLPTSWTDGAQFGFGAEIGISTQKLHARGPMALSEIVTYKYIIAGDGQIRI